MPVVADGMDNLFNLTYGAYPDRYYIIHKGQIQILGPMVTETTKLLPEAVMSGLELYLKI